MCKDLLIGLTSNIIPWQESQPTKNKIFVETSTVYPTLAGEVQLSSAYTPASSIYLIGELDTLISSIPHSHLVMAPVFGAPQVAEEAKLIVVMAGDYRSKKEVAHLLIPAIGYKVMDFGGNLEKGQRISP